MPTKFFKVLENESSLTKFRVYEKDSNGDEVALLYKGDINGAENVVVRVHS